jgi:hypothetical protein
MVRDPGRARTFRTLGHVQLACALVMAVAVFFAAVAGEPWFPFGLAPVVALCSGVTTIAVSRRQ